jgi:hypothetical protein
MRSEKDKEEERDIIKAEKQLGFWMRATSTLNDCVHNTACKSFNPPALRCIKCQM